MPRSRAEGREPLRSGRSTEGGETAILARTLASPQSWHRHPPLTFHRHLSGLGFRFGEAD